MTFPFPEVGYVSSLEGSIYLKFHSKASIPDSAVLFLRRLHGTMESLKTPTIRIQESIVVVQIVESFCAILTHHKRLFPLFRGKFAGTLPPNNHKSHMMTILKTHLLFSGFSFKFTACREGHYSPSATPYPPSDPPEQCLRAVGGTWRVPTTTVDRCFSFSKGVFSGSMFVFGGCKPFQIKIRMHANEQTRSQTTTATKGAWTQPSTGLKLPRAIAGKNQSTPFWANDFQFVVVWRN